MSHSNYIQLRLIKIYSRKHNVSHEEAALFWVTHLAEQWRAGQ